MTAQPGRAPAPEPEIRVPAARLEAFAAALLAAGGFTAQEAKTIAASLTLSELLGHASHGVIRVKEYLEDVEQGKTVSNAGIKIDCETPSSIFADAGRGAGQVVMPALLEKLYAKAKTQAVVTAAIRNCGHIGRIGEWVEGPARAGYAALLLVNDNGGYFVVAPPGGRKAVTSTNPLAFAIPLADGEIFMSDMSTSSIAAGKVRVAKFAGASLPPGCAQDAEGKPTTNPHDLFGEAGGTLLPMGGAQQGYKGFALSMFVDMLAAGLSGGHTPPAPEGAAYANTISLTLWNPEFFAGLDHMRKEAEKYIGFIRASAPVDPAKPIRLPGDRLNVVRHEHEKNGIPVSAGLARNMLKLAQDLGVPPLPEFQGHG